MGPCSSVTRKVAPWLILTDGWAWTAEMSVRQGDHIKTWLTLATRRAEPQTSISLKGLKVLRKDEGRSLIGLISVPGLDTVSGVSRGARVSIASGACRFDRVVWQLYME